ncbi:MAG: hypothetical protein M1828_003440 [Chrysothrix sp. TS-e1954]|nr:MAG: hypothetical protein M1828_003440 [Chrysothrix sp. TS-e1954]
MSSTISHCPIAVENVFGPIVARSCLGGFDFTLLFEETVLTILPVVIASLLALVRLHLLHTEVTKVKHSRHVLCKMLAYLGYLVLQVVLLSLWAQPHVAKTRATLATTALSLPTFLVFMWLSYWEHKRSLRPSTLLTLYLGLSTLLDLARVRTLFNFFDDHVISSVFLASLCVKLFILCLELTEKRNLLLNKWKIYGPEDTASAYRRALFLWLNRLFAKSYRSPLSLDTLPKIDHDILSASDPDLLRCRWREADKSNSYALLSTFLVHYRWTVLAACPPRLAYTGFTFAQPFLITRVLAFIAKSHDQRSANVAYGLIGAYALVYIGAAISLALYEHKVYRTLSKFRGSLITLIYEKTLLLESTRAWNTDSITLMSADIDRLGICVQDLHELYAGTLEVALCLWLLYLYLGVAVAAVAGCNVLCLGASAPIATAAGKSQVPWLSAIETRLTGTAHALGNFKLIRMTGLTECISSSLKNLRSAEILAARRYRICNIFLTIGYYLSYAFSPVWGFGTYILIAQATDTETLTQGTAFAALALFQLLNKPTVLIIDAIEHAQTVIECFARMQEYLTRTEQKSYRTRTLDQEEVHNTNGVGDSVQLGQLMLTTREAPLIVAAMHRLTLRYSSEQKPVLRDVSLEIRRSLITMVVGPVGCGKSSLLKLLLGEAPPPDERFWTNFSKAAYCAQQPWVSKATVRENIVGMSSWDEAWYLQVLRACALVSDINGFPKGDQTEAGMHGSSLSGGQRIRLSLARALYSREAVLVLDDVLTGLDPATEQDVSAAIFGPNGLVRRLKSTVIMATSSTHHLQFADHVVVLDEGGRVTQDLAAQEYLCNKNHEAQTCKDNGSPRTRITKHESFDVTSSEPAIPISGEDAAGTKRQMGDIKAYTFYSRTAGWKLAGQLSFSQDLELIDSDLPAALDKTVFSVLQTIFTAALVFVGSGYLAASLPICLLVIYGIQRYYLRTSRQLRHVDIEAREPLFANFLDTVTSIASIRAHGWTEEYKRRNCDALNSSQTPYYLMWSIQRWLTLVLNLFVAGLAVLLVALATNVQGGSTVFLGVALSNLVNFGTTLQLLVADWTQLETAICAVSRIKTYVSDTVREDSNSQQATTQLSWPTQGKIVFEGVTASYPSAPSPALRNVNLTVSSGEKIAICGRTGSGKSTLMTTLLQMVDLDAGAIFLDGINIADMPREAVRRYITTVPQETFFISGTVRENLDPFHRANDESLQSMLKSLALQDLLDATGGLDAELSVETLSSGQQQLFCLARAIVKGGPILLLDEATSRYMIPNEKFPFDDRLLITFSVDSSTSDIMQNVLRSTFGVKTVIAIAHRLETVIDFDRVIILDKGEIIESGNPKELLASAGSALDSYQTR